MVIVICIKASIIVLMAAKMASTLMLKLRKLTCFVLLMYSSYVERTTLFTFLRSFLMAALSQDLDFHPFARSHS